MRWSIYVRAADPGRRNHAHSISAQKALGRLFVPDGIKIAFAPLGYSSVSLWIPFVVRTCSRTAGESRPELEEAAATLGVRPIQTFRRVTSVRDAAGVEFTGLALAFARALGEYGSGDSARATCRCNEVDALLI